MGGLQQRWYQSKEAAIWFLGREASQAEAIASVMDLR
jgi:hypothetical protein